MCRHGRRARAKNSYELHRNKRLAYGNQYSRDRRRRLRAEIVVFLGGVCVRCKFSELLCANCNVIKKVERGENSTYWKGKRRGLSSN